MVIDADLSEETDITDSIRSIDLSKSEVFGIGKDWESNAKVSLVFEYVHAIT